MADASIAESMEFKRYQTHIDLYKFYLDLAIKIDAFYLTASGVFLSIYFTKPNGEGMFISAAATLCAIASVGFYYWERVIGKYIEADEAVKELLMTEIGAEFSFLKKILRASAAFAMSLAVTLTVFIIVLAGRGLPR